MKNTAYKPSIFRPIMNIFGRYHLTIFTVVFVGGLATAVLILNLIMTQSSDISGYTSPLDSTTFDQATIDRITKLKLSSDAPEFSLPSGRTSPFSE